MPAVRTLGLVIRSVDVFETSRVVTLFTRDLGKVSALGKGARRLKSPFQSALDLLSVCDIVLLHKASEALDLLTEAALMERFDPLRRDLAALYAGYYIAELLHDLTDHHDPHPRLFDAARVTLRNLGDPGLRPRRVLRFELACLRNWATCRRWTLACIAATRWTPSARRSRSAWPAAASSARRAGPASRTSRRSRAGASP